TDMVHVPYKAVQQAITELIAGQVDVIFDNQPSIGPHVLAGRVRALAVTGPAHSIAFPELPTIAEAGVAGYAITTWTAMVAPKGVSSAIITRLNAGIAQACAALRPKLEATGQECATKSPVEFARFVKDEQAKWGDIVRKSGAKVD
ncbi:MAG TPA: tripartite tricarboxylate transporter substrate-binding protein, partial [Burkholderiales bacterium]|nr:tripartite tricarboxylate transporter substrate-binding protein [Burkholderiales bacterium]